MRTAGLEDYLLARRTLREWKDLILESWKRTAAPAIQFATSGTSGSPRYHTHFLDHLEEEVRFFQSRLPFPPQRIVSTVPAHHIYGYLFSALLPSMLSCPRIRIPLENPVFQPGDWVIAHPFVLKLWKSLQMTFPDSLGILTSTGSLEVEEWEWLTSQEIPVIEIFGSSETSGLGYWQNPQEDFTLLPWWTLSRCPTVLYRTGDSRPLPPPDILVQSGERTFTPGGRKDRSVKIGGTLVSSARVTQVLQDHPGVAQAAVKVIETPLGNRLQAQVVPHKEGGDLTEENLRAWAGRHLESAERPVSYQILPSLPVKIPGGSF